MIVKEKTVYQCEFCRRNMFVKHAMEKHIEWCYKNPKNKTKCEGCKHLKETENEYTGFYFNGYSESESTRKSKSFKCEKLDKILYPLVVERKELNTKYPETFEGQEPMPKECGHYEDGW